MTENDRVPAIESDRAIDRNGSASASQYDLFDNILWLVWVNSTLSSLILTVNAIGNE